VFYAVARAGGTDVTVLVIGLGVALVAAVAAGLFVAARGGRVTDRRQL
jgi:biopolymer transport protein ExbB/TolQ